MSDELRSKYSTARFYFDILTILCILQIGVSVVIFIAAFTSGQASTWAMAPFISKSTVMWLAFIAAFLGLGQIAAIQVSQAVLDIADNSRLVLELTIKHHNAKIDGTVPQITKLRSEPKLKRDATPKGAG
ncbi:hypothetical protein [Roseinatronobacter sp. S2]|uniref:hypothetical protein n=1 Tax=Roseinatronobacter sp. S2 TaxID=3035471 RepID=UPI0024107F86|nr:hypothetical protein [Roseinatronobacter sp. S2]WFE77191.1 hypothetical protein P8S53_20250 [Roseinatronobacter sp. S2]